MTMINRKTVETIYNHEDGYTVLYIAKKSKSANLWESKEPYRLAIKSWHRKTNILLEMSLVSIGETDMNLSTDTSSKVNDEVLNTRHMGLNPMQHIDLHYRGLRVYNIKQDLLMPYPCWEINAHAMFGDAEQYVAINRNSLLPHKTDDIYRMVASCADEALNYLWAFIAKKIYKDDLGEDLKNYFKHRICCKAQKDLNEDNWQRQLNGLALSSLYQQAVSVFDTNINYYKGAHHLEKLAPALAKLANMRIAGMERDTVRDIPNVDAKTGESITDGEFKAVAEIIESKTAFDVSKVFKGGISSATLIGKGQFCNVRVSFSFCHKNPAPCEFVLDIFSEYLYKRSINVHAKDVFVFFNDKSTDNQSPEKSFTSEWFTFVYKFPMLRGHKWQPPETVVNDWMKALARFACKTTVNKDDNVNLGAFIILPGLEKYDNLRMCSLPLYMCPEEFRSLGSVLVLPITFNDLIRWVNKIRSNRAILEEEVSLDLLPPASSDLHPLNRRINILAQKIHEANKLQLTTKVTSIELSLREAVMDFFNTLRNFDEIKSLESKQVNAKDGLKSTNNVYHNIFRDDGLFNGIYMDNF